MCPHLPVVASELVTRATARAARMFGAQVPVVQRKNHPTHEDNRQDEDAPGQGEKGIAPEVQRPLDHRDTEEAEARQVGLREHDRGARSACRRQPR